MLGNLADLQGPPLRTRGCIVPHRNNAPTTKSGRGAIGKVCPWELAPRTRRGTAQSPSNPCGPIPELPATDKPYPSLTRITILHSPPRPHFTRPIYSLLFSL